MVSSYDNYRLVIFCDVRQWFHPALGELDNWIRWLEFFPRRVLLTPRDVSEWGKSEELLAEHITLLQNTPKALKNLPESMNLSKDKPLFTPPTVKKKKNYVYPKELYFRSDRWLKANAPSTEIIHKTLDSLERYLGPTGFYWLCACAVFPMIQWNITTYLGYKLDKSHKALFDKPNLYKIINLPWFRHGYMPDWLRVKLISRLKLNQDIQVRLAIKDLLLSALMSKDENFSIEVADTHKQDHNIVSPLLSILRQKVKRESYIHEYIFRTFIDGFASTSLAFRTPQGFVSMLEQHVKEDSTKQHMRTNLILFGSLLLVAFFLSSDLHLEMLGEWGSTFWNNGIWQ